MVYRFAEFALDEERLALSRLDQPVSLAPKPLALLLHLLRRHPTVVGYDELLATVWPDAVVTRSSVARAINSLRRALGDRGKSESVIRSIRGLGYGIAVDVLLEGNVALRSRGGAPVTAQAFVGRDQPLRALSDWLAQAAAGRGSVATIVGEPGIGKTRLLSALAERAEVAGWTVLAGQCREERGAPPVWPWVEVLRDAATKFDSTAIEQAIGVRGAELLRVEPSLLGGGVARLPNKEIPDDSEQRFRLFSAAESFFAALESEAPLLITLDDLQWADATSLELFAHLARRASGHSILLLACHRPAESAHPHSPPLDISARHADPASHAQNSLSVTLDRLASLPGARPSIQLDGLAAEHLAEIAADVAGVSLDEDQRNTLHEQSGGNPFYAIELVRSGNFISSRAADTTDDDQAMSQRSPVPERIRAMVRVRIEDLSDEARSLLQAGAVAGFEFTLPLLALVLETTEALLLDPIQEVESAHLLFEDPSNPGCFRFFHALVPEALYEGLTRRHRAELHGRVARALERIHGANPGTHAAALARHWEIAAAGGDRSQAVEYARRAGDFAFGQLAFAEATSHYRHAIDWLVAGATESGTSLFDLWMALSRAQFNSGQLEASEQAAWEAIKLAEIARSPRLVTEAVGRIISGQYMGQESERLDRVLEEAIAIEESEASGGDPCVRSRLWGFRARTLIYRAPFDQVDDCSIRSLVLAQQAGDPSAELTSVATRDLILATEPRYEERAVLSRDRVRLAIQQGHAMEEFRARVFNAQRLIQEIEPDRFDDEIHELERLSDDMHHSHQCEGFVLDLRALRAIWQGELDLAAQLVPRIQKAWEQADPVWGMMSVGAKNHVIASLGDTYDELDSSEELISRGASQFALPTPYRCALALRRIDLGRDAEAREDFAFLSRNGYSDLRRDATYIIALAQLAQLAHNLIEVARAGELEGLLEPFAGRYVSGHTAGVRGAVDRYRGLLLWTRGDLDGAEDLLLAAIDQERRMRAPPWEAIARIDLARLLLSRDASDDSSSAGEELRRVDQICKILPLAGVAKLAEPVRRQLLAH